MTSALLKSKNRIYVNTEYIVALTASVCKVTEHPSKPFHEICYRPHNFSSICLKFAPNVVKYVKDTIVL